LHSDSSSLWSNRLASL